MAPPESARAATPTLLQLSSTLLTFAVACGLGLLFILNLPTRKREAAPDEQATFRGDPLLVVQFPGYEAEPVGHSVQDVSLRPRQPIPDQLPPLNQPDQAPPAEQPPEFTAAERMFEAFPAEEYRPTDLQPEFEPEPAQTTRRNNPRPATGRAAAMQPRGVISTPRMSASRPQQTQFPEHQQPRVTRWPTPNGPYPSHAHPEPNSAAPETSRPGAESTPYAARDAQLAAELRSVREQLSLITKQLANRDQQVESSNAPPKIVTPKRSPAVKPDPVVQPDPVVPAPAAAEPAFDPLAEPEFPTEQNPEPGPEPDAEPQTLPQPEMDAEPAASPQTEPETQPEPEPEPEPEPQTEPVPDGGLPQEPVPAPIPEPVPTAPEPAVPGPQPAAAPDLPQPAVEPEPPAPAPVTPVAPTVPGDPSATPGSSAELRPPQPTEPVVHVVQQAVPVMSDERLAGMLPLPPADGGSSRPGMVPGSLPSTAIRPSPDSQFRSAIQPPKVVSRAPQTAGRPATAAEPLHGGTVARGPGKGSPPRPSGFSRSVSGVRESLDEGREELFRPVVGAPGWLKTLFGRSTTTGQQSVPGPAVPGPAVHSGVGARSKVAAVPPSSTIFAEQPRGGVQRASAAVGDAATKSSIQRASHSATTAASAASGGNLQTYHRSLRDGHNKPGRLFDPHAWAAPEWLTD